MDLSFFSHPKPWISPFKEIQMTAVKSWRLVAKSSITLLGDDEGTFDASKTLEVNCFSDIKKNEWGTPLVSDIFQYIQSKTQRGQLICYINTDIVIGEDFIATLACLQQNSESLGDQWLAIGCRTDLDFKSTDDLTNKQDGINHGPGGIDYFVFPSGLFSFVYPFALGKFVWDQWLVGNVHRRGIPVVDCSKTLRAIHLNAPWFFRGAPETDRKTIEESEEAKRNRGFDYYIRTIADGSTHYTEKDGNNYFVKSLKSI